MKTQKLVSLLVAVLMVFSMAACSNSQSELSAQASPTQPIKSESSHHTLALSADQPPYQVVTLAHTSITPATLSVSSTVDDCGIVYDESQIIRLLKGASLLAAGGGGSYHLGVSLLEEFKQKNPETAIEVTVYDVEDMEEDESTFGVAIMGSPSAHASIPDLVKVALKSYDETLEVARRYDKNPQYALALELGGANTLIPLLCAMKYGLNVVDADMCGRAVPGLETSLSNINGLPTAPFALTDTNGNSYDVNMVDPYDADGVETIALAILDKLQSNGGFTGFYYSADDLVTSIPTDSLTRCVQIGEVIELFESMSIEERRNTNLFELLNQSNYEVQCVALTETASSAQHFHQESAAGGARDVGYYYLGVEGEAGNYFYVQFDNETMAVSVLNEDGTFDCLATAPCIITMYDERTGLPLTNADLKAHYVDGIGDEPKVMLGIIKSDSKWWLDMDAVSEAWTPYLEEAGHTGGIVRYNFE